LQSLWNLPSFEDTLVSWQSPGGDALQMTETILTIGIPTLAVLVGILLNRNDANNIRTELASVRTELKTDIAGLDTKIERFRDVIHGDMREFNAITRETEHRLTRLEPH
jgi:hypothetical protein